MSCNVSEAELMAFLVAVERGEVLLRPEREPQYVYAGNVHYAASNGWHIIIFNDANEWDYIDFVQTADGRIAEFEEIDEMPQVSRHAPTDEVAWSRYGIPGYCIFRCTACGTRVESRPRYDDPPLCNSCDGK